MTIMLTCLVMFLMGLNKYLMNSWHFLVSLLSLEMCCLGMFGLVWYFCLMHNMDYVILVYFLIMVICEGSLGLAVLVCVSCGYGSDQLSSFNMLSC